MMMTTASANPNNPPDVQEPVLQGERFSPAWYQWFTLKVAKILDAPAAATAPPATANAPGTPGQIAFDPNFLYVCVGVNSWKRTAIVAW